MISHEEHISLNVFFESIAEAFSEEAASLLPEEAIAQVLREEKCRFENASLLSVAPEKLVRHNTMRYCKDLLRRQQPFFFLYAALCFLAEVSVGVCAYRIFMEIWQRLVSRDGSPFFFLYGLSAVIGIVAYSTFSNSYLRKVLGESGDFGEDRERIIRAGKSLSRFRLFLAFGILAAVLLAAAIFTVLGLANTVHVSLSACFLAYFACMLLSGIHNVVYSGHAISFFEVGISMLSGRPDEEIKNAAEHYIRQRCLQMLSLSHKPLGELQENKEMALKLRRSVRSHLVTQRVYYALGIAILFALDVACLAGLRTHMTVALSLFFAIALLCTCALLFAFLCANTIIKFLQGQK